MLAMYRASMLASTTVAISDLCFMLVVNAVKNFKHLQTTLLIE